MSFTCSSYLNVTIVQLTIQRFSVSDTGTGFCWDSVELNSCVFQFILSSPSSTAKVGVFVQSGGGGASLASVKRPSRV